MNYFKYGLTLSKKIKRIEPYISYYQYANGDINKLTDEDFNDVLRTNRVITFGTAIEVKEGFIMPEINYQFIENDFNSAFIFYSLGFRFHFNMK